MITAISKRLQRLTKGRAGQHLSEFLMLFLALSVAFVGLRLYLKRGVNAKLKDIEMQLNSAVQEGVPSSVSDYNPNMMPINVNIAWGGSTQWEGIVNIFSDGYKCYCENHVCTLACWNGYKNLSVVRSAINQGWGVDLAPATYQVTWSYPGHGAKTFNLRVLAG